MQLRTKIIASLSVLMGLYIVADYLVKGSALMKMNDQLEQDQAQKTTVRVKGALENNLLTLQGRAMDWASADGTAEFIEGLRPEFEQGRLAGGVLSRESLDLLYLCDAQGKVLWGEYTHPMGGQSQSKGSIAAFPERGGTLAPAFRTGWRLEDQMRGILRAQNGYLDTELGPLLLSTELVPRSSGASGSSGFVMLGRFVSKDMTKKIESGGEAKNLNVSFFGSATSTPGLAAYVETFSGEPLIEKRSDDWLKVYHLVKAGMGDTGDGTGNSPWLILSADVSRDISKLAQTTARSGLVTTLTAGLILLFALILLLQKIVLKPIESLMNNALLVAEDDTADVHFNLDRDDEVGVLSREFDNMMDKLAASRAALVDTAREAGKSEIATGILHNVGNVLNSVNVSSSILLKKTEELAVSDLEALNGIIVEHAEDLAGFMTNDPRGKHFQPFLAALTEQLAKGKLGIASELKSLDQGIDRIRDLVNSQQDYVNRAEVIEICDLTTVLERALKVSENVEAYHAGMTIVREYDEIPRVPIDRYKTLEILVNLIQNARQAVEKQGGNQHQLTLRLMTPSEGKVLIEVQDTGVGIEPGSLAKVFDHGYTTRPNGHGFGLHAAANAATEMGGALTVRSEGEGKGATFAFELPIRAPQRTREAI